MAPTPTFKEGTPLHLPKEAYLNPSDPRSKSSKLEDPYYERIADACKTRDDFCHVMASLSEESSKMIHSIMLTFLTYEKELPEQLEILREKDLDDEWGYVWPHLKGSDSDKLRLLFTEYSGECPRIFCDLVEQRIIKMETLVEELRTFTFDAPVLGACLASLYRIMHRDYWWALIKQVLQPPENFHILVIVLTHLRTMDEGGDSTMSDVKTINHCKDVCEAYALTGETVERALQSFGLSREKEKEREGGPEDEETRNN